MDWDELKQRVRFLRETYHRLRIPLRPGQGLALALDEAEALADGRKSALPATDDNAARTAHDAHVVWSLAENVKLCIDAGLDLSAHLANITTGTTDFGTAAEDNRAIFYKDFEYEVFMMATLIARGERVRLPPAPNDPLCEFEVDPFAFQLKHPTSTARPARRLAEFNRRLAEQNRMGIFVVGIEDMFELADGGRFDEQGTYETWLEGKRAEMDAHGRPLLVDFRRYPQIAGVVQTATFVRYIAGDSQLTRTSNSCIFDGDGRDREAWFPHAMRLLAIFNPNPVRASEL